MTDSPHYLFRHGDRAAGDRASCGRTGGRRRWRQRSCRGGISLLEVVLALAIMATAMAVLGQLIRMGADAASTGHKLTRAQLVAETVLGELASGAIPAQAASSVVEIDPAWTYSVTVADSGVLGVLTATVTVSETTPGPRPVNFSLTRWIRDPNWVTPAQELAAEQAAAQESGL